MPNARFLIIYALFFLIAMVGLRAYFEAAKTALPGDQCSYARLTAADRAALRPFTERLPPPQPGEWRYDTKEPGQSFAAFALSKWNRPDSVRHTICLQPLDTAALSPSPHIELLKQFVEAYFALPARVLPAIELRGREVLSRLHPATSRRQFLTGDILHLLQSRLPDDAFCCAGVTVHDLYPEPSWNFVFGQASLVHRVGVFSFARYDPACERRQPFSDTAGAGTLILRRSCKVIGHEIGHMFGLYHCRTYRCIMNGSNHLAESDAKPIHLCPECLRKLQYSVGFSLPDRYRKLAAFYGSAGFSDWQRQARERLAAVVAVRQGGTLRRSP
jgi:archaemetzincin